MEALLDLAKLLLGSAQDLVLPVSVALLAVIVVAYIQSSFFDNKNKVYGVPVPEVPGPGIAYRNARFLSLVETPFEGGNTLAALFSISAQKYKDRKLLGTRPLLTREEVFNKEAGKAFETVSLGEFQWQTYGQVYERTVAVGAGLLSLGHGKDEKVAIFAETCADWLVSLQGSFQQNLTVVTVYASLGDEALAYSLNQTKVSTVFCDSKQLDKILGISEQLPHLKRVVVFDEQVPGGTTRSAVKEKEGLVVVSLPGLEQKGRENPVAPSLPAPADMAVIMYTSGSTGLPKGVMMSHGSVVATLAAIIAMVPATLPDDCYFAYLPLAHVLELAAECGMVAIGASIGYGSPLTMVNTAPKIKKGTVGDAPCLRPTLMAAVPMVLDRIREGVRKQIAAKPAFVQKLFDFAYKRRLAAVEGSWFGAWGLERAFWDFLIFRKVRAAVGGQVRYILSGGAPLSPDTQRFMNICFNIPVGQGYGLTETCAGATFLEWSDPSVGRVGPPIPCCYIKLIDWAEGGYSVTDKPFPRGEICIGGPLVTMGYYESPEKTSEVYTVDSKGMRWFHTGDIGLVHPDGVFKIVDRKKDIVKLQAGEYVSLGKVEAVLIASPLLENLMLYADSFQNFPVALVVPEFSALRKVAEEKGIPDGENEALCSNPALVAEVLKSMQQVGKKGHLEKFEIPARIKLLPEPWTPETGLVTASMKVKREAIKKAFSEELKGLYA